MTLFIFTQQKASLPSWAPFVGEEFVHITGDFETAQAVAPGPGPGGRDRRHPGRQDHLGRARRRPRRRRHGHRAQVHEADPSRRDAADAAENEPQRHGRRGRPRAPLPGTSRKATTSRSPRPNRTPTSTPSSPPSTPTPASTSSCCSPAAPKASATAAASSRAPSAASSPSSTTSPTSTKRSPQRRLALAGVIHNFGLLTTELGRRDAEIERFVSGSQAALGNFANQQQAIQESLVEFPATLAAVQAGLGQLQRLLGRRPPGADRPDPAGAGARPGAAGDRALLRPDDGADPRPDPALHPPGAPGPDPHQAGRGAAQEDRRRLRQQPRRPQRVLQRARLQAEGQGRASSSTCPGSTTTSTPPTTSPTAGGPVQRGLVMITCNGASLGYGLARHQPVPEDPAAERARIPRTNQLPVDPGRNAPGDLLRTGSQMSKKAPSTTQLLVITGFALSCFGILLFLWITFGGPTPFKAKSYEITIPFDEAAQLAQQSDVRISGVNVGKVKSIERNPDKLAIATIEIDDKYAPIPKDTRAILRTKTLLAETYVELTTGNRDGPKLEDGATLPAANVAQLGPDRRDLPHLRPADPRRLPGMDAGTLRWRSRAAGQSLSTAFGELDTTFTEFDELFRTLDTQQLAVQPAVQQRRRRPRRLPRPRRPARGPDPHLQRRLPDHRRPRPRHRSAVPRLPDLRGRVAADARPAQRVRDQHRPADAPARARRPNSSRRRWSPSPSWRRKRRASSKASRTVIARSTTGFPAFRKLLRDDFPPFLRARRPVPAQPQPDPHRPRPLQTRDHRGDGQRHGAPPTRSTSARQGTRSTTCARWARSARNRWRPSPAAPRPTATAPTASRSPTRTSPAACSASTPASAARA